MAKNKKEEVKKEENIFKLKGVIASYEYGASPADKSGKKKHRLGIRVHKDEYDRLLDAIDEEGVFDGISESFQPTWYKKPSVVSDQVYVNLASSYDIRTVYLEDGKRVESTLADMTADMGVLHGSTVSVALPLVAEKGVIYPRCVAFAEIKVSHFGDCFDEDDFELPFT